MAHLIAQGVGFLKNLAASTWTRSRRESDILSLSIDAKDNCHIAWMEVEFRGEWIHIYVWLSLFAVRLTITTLLIGCCCLVAKLCLTLCDPMDCNPPGFSVYGISQAKYWSGLPCPPPGVLPNASSALAGRFFTSELPGKPLIGYTPIKK